MWLEVPLPHTDYYVTWSSAFPLPHMEYSLAWSSASAQGIYWDLKFRSSASAYRIVCDLGALKWRNSASAQGKYCDLEVSQFRFHTRVLTFKSRNSASAQRISCDLKFRFRTRNILCLEVQQFCFRTQNNLDVIWNSALLLLHVNITFLWKIHSHSTTHPFLNFRDVLHDWRTLWRTDKQSNREAPGKSRR